MNSGASITYHPHLNVANDLDGDGRGCELEAEARVNGSVI